MIRAVTARETRGPHATRGVRSALLSLVLTVAIVNLLVPLRGREFELNQDEDRVFREQHKREGDERAGGEGFPRTRPEGPVLEERTSSQDLR